MALTPAKISTATNIGKNPTSVIVSGYNSETMYTVPSGRIFIGLVSAGQNTSNFSINGASLGLLGGGHIPDITLMEGDTVTGATSTSPSYAVVLIGIESDAS